MGFPAGQVGFPAGQKWRQREENEVLGSAGSPFAYLMGWRDGLAVEDVIDEVREKEKRKRKKPEWWVAVSGQMVFYLVA